MAKQPGIKSITRNRRAYHDYFIDETFEAGVELFGTEVKSVRLGTVNLKDSFCTVKDGQLFVHGMHISPYEKGNIFNREQYRKRRLLLHKKEILKLAGQVQQKGYTLVPLQVYFKNGRVKIEIGLAKGKKLYDKRESIKKKDAGREAERDYKVNLR